MTSSTRLQRKVGLLTALFLPLIMLLGFVQSAQAQISKGLCGHVYIDTNCNGTYEVGTDTRLNGVQVQLKKLNGTSYDLVTTLTTATDAVDGDGVWQVGFGPGDSGTYQVCLVVPTGYTASAAIKNPISLPGDINGSTIISNITYNSNTDGVLQVYDFLICQNQPAPGAITGRVTNCLTGSSLPTVVSVTLKQNGNVVTTINTNANGNYSFSNLTPGNYTVCVPNTVSSNGATYTIQGSAATPVMVTSNGTATADFCYNPPPPPTGRFTTYTQGGWGATPNGNNPGKLLHTNFAVVYPSGVIIGGGYKLTFTSAQAITNFLPQGGTPKALTASEVNSTRTITVFAGQVLALTLSRDFSNAGITRTGLANLRVTSGKLTGYTVAEVLTLANAVLGGNLSALPAGVSLSNLNDIVTKINENYDGGTANNGYLQ